MKNESYNVGDLVYKSSIYSSAYPGWKVDRGMILSVKSRVVSEQSLGATDRAMYRSRYGQQDKYTMFEMVISTNMGNYLVSQFGFNKDVIQNEQF